MIPTRGSNSREYHENNVDGTMDKYCMESYGYVSHFYNE